MSDRYGLRVSKSAEKDLFGLQSKQFAQIAKKIFSLSGNPRPQDCSTLKGFKGGYRVDQGEFRILYTIDDAAKIIDIFRVGKRNHGEGYRVSASQTPLTGGLWQKV